MSAILVKCHDYCSAVSFHISPRYINNTAQHIFLPVFLTAIRLQNCSVLLMVGVSERMYIKCVVSGEGKMWLSQIPGSVSQKQQRTRRQKFQVLYGCWYQFISSAVSRSPQAPPESSAKRKQLYCDRAMYSTQGAWACFPFRSLGAGVGQKREKNVWRRNIEM